MNEFFHIFVFNCMKRKHLFQIILLTSLIMGLNGCYPGKKTATHFINQLDSVSVMVVAPNKITQKFYPFHPAFTDSFPEHNPFDVETSFLLSETNDSISKNIFMESLIRRLVDYRVKVFNEKAFDRFLEQKGSKYIFTIAQAEILEFDDVKTERALIDTTLYRQDFLVRTLEQNTWFEFVEVDPVNSADGEMQVLFSTFFDVDQVDGQFRYNPFSGKVRYEYTSELLKPSDVYALNQYAGRKNADYIFDFLLNNYITTHSDPFLFNPNRYVYRPNQQKVTATGRETSGFVEIK